METGNDILDRMLRCLDMIDELPEEERKLLAEDYWNFVERR